MLTPTRCWVCSLGTTGLVLAQIQLPGLPQPLLGWRQWLSFSAKEASLCLADFCQIPCLNGGRCVGRDECWCPSNSTGKFCHLPAPSLEKKQGGRAPKTPAGGSMKQSTYTLPLSNQLGEHGWRLQPLHFPHTSESSYLGAPHIFINRPEEAMTSLYLPFQARLLEKWFP